MSPAGGSSVGSTNRPHTSTLAQSQDCATCSQCLTAWARAISASMCGSLSSASARMWAAASALRFSGPVSGAISSRRQPGALGDVDDREPVQHLRAVAALAADALGLGQHADAFVEADVRGVQPGPLGDLADRQQRLLGRGGHRAMVLDLKSC